MAPAVIRRPARPHVVFPHVNLQVDVPTYDSETYEGKLMNEEWSKEETDYLVDTYRECNGKWPVIIDHYTFSDGPNRSMEDLKERFYTISAKVLAHNTPIDTMTAPQFSLHQTLTNFKAAQESSRKRLAEGHLSRGQNEADEETVLLSELQRIMRNQASTDSEREVCFSHEMRRSTIYSLCYRTCAAD